MKIIIIGILFFAMHTAFAQQAAEPIVRESLHELGRYGSAAAMRTFDTRGKNLKGSPFLFDDWRSGEITMSHKSEKGQIKYDTFEDVLLFRKDSAHRPIVVENVGSFLFEGKHRSSTLVFQKLPQSVYDGYFELILEDKICVLKKHHKKLVKASRQATYSSGNEYDEFVEDHSLYLKDLTGNFHKVDGKIKTFTAIFQGNEKAIKKFIKDNQLSLRNEQHVVRLVSYYNQLL